MASSRKKVIIRTSDHATQAGYLPASRLLNPATAQVELLDTAGRILTIPLTSIRYVAYVRDFNLDDPHTPERLTRRAFLARPRTEGLWLRLTFHDGEELEGLAALDLALLDDAVADHGLFLIPPDVRSNTQRLYVPRAAIATLHILAVITTPSKLPAPKTKPRAAELNLPFPDSPP